MNIIISHEASLKLKYFIDIADGEISGIGKSEIDEDGTIHLVDLEIIKQKCTAANTTIDDDAQAQFFLDLRKKGENIKNWNVWWHSHANLAVFWSQTDDDTIRNHSSVQTYLVSVVSNKKQEFKARLDIFPKDTSPFKIQTVSTHDLDVEIEYSDQLSKQREKLNTIIENAKEKLNELDKLESENPRIEKYCRKEIESKVEDLYKRNFYNNRYSFQNPKQISLSRIKTITPFSKPEKWKWEDDENILPQKINDEINSLSNDPFYANEHPDIDEINSFLD